MLLMCLSSVVFYIYAYYLFALHLNYVYLSCIFLLQNKHNESINI